MLAAIFRIVQVIVLAQAVTRLVYDHAVRHAARAAFLCTPHHRFSSTHANHRGIVRVVRRRLYPEYATGNVGHILSITNLSYPLATRTCTRRWAVGRWTRAFRPSDALTLQSATCCPVNSPASWGMTCQTTHAVTTRSVCHLQHLERASALHFLLLVYT